MQRALTIARIRKFQKTITDHYRAYGRDFPWRPPTLQLRKNGTADPYVVLVSEIMLQQTQVARVVPKYPRWIKRFPNPEALTKATVGDVVKYWQGLGYNRRALNLKRAAEIIVRRHKGIFPKTIREIGTLPGVGPYTAGAVAAFAFKTPSAFIETNSRTVYLHFFFKRRKRASDKEILTFIHRTLPKKNIREWYNALMDYGAMLKETAGNANTRSVYYTKQAAFKGSKRELRGALLRKATEQATISASDVASEKYVVADVLYELVHEGFLRKKGDCFMLAK